MANTPKHQPVKTVGFPGHAYPEVVRIANELAALEDRSAHDAIARLVREEGRKKIERLKSTQINNSCQLQNPEQPTKQPIIQSARAG